MPTFIQRPTSVIEIVYSHDFKWNDGFGGFSFDCDSLGNVELKHGLARENYEKCIDGTFDVRDLGVQSYERRIRTRAIILCHCGREVCLANFTNSCDCGSDYNMSGMRLAPRQQWGEETGEHWTECY